MMTFGQDQVVVSPLKDLYDTNIMQMAIAAAKDMYDKNYADMKEFAKTYGDFVSPIGNYTQQYYDMSKGLVNKKIDELYARGIDPLRSAQGRAEIQKIINSVDVGRLNQMKAETEAAKEYVKNRARMQAENRYNPEFEKWMLGGRTLETWDGSQPWTATSPYLYQDLNEYTGHIFDKMQDEYISSDGQYDYTGVSEERRRAALTPQLAGIISTPLGQYHLELAKQDAAIKYGRTPTDAEVMQQFQDNIITSTKEYERRNRTENKDYARRIESSLRMAEDDRRTANDIRANNVKEATKYRYDALRAADTNLDGKLDADEVAAYSQAAREALENGGYQYSGGSGSRSGGSGGSGQQVPAMGPADQLSVQQELNYQQNKQDEISKYEKQEKDAFRKQKAIYETLNDSQKKNAVLYGKAYRTLHNNKSSKKAKDDAKLTIDGLNRSSDANFVKWRNQFNHRMEISQNKDMQWINNSTTQGLAGYQKSDEYALHRNSHAIFERNNIVPDLTDDQKLALNKQLGYSVNENNGRDGVMTTNRDFADITISKMTGDRRYRYNTPANRISRIIKGKEFTIDAKDVAKRKYGAGSMSGRRYNVIVELATFDDPDVVAELNTLSDDQLKHFGVKKVETNNGATAYKIPIISRFGHGQGRANVNNIGLKAVQGQSEAGKQLATQQAREITANLYGQ